MWSRAVIKENLKSVNIDSLRFDSAWVILVRERVSQVFGFEPCLWQIKVSLACLRGDKHVVSISRTGSGKTLTFWIPLLLAEDGILILVVPLNLLGKQNIDQLTRAGISAIVLTGETATPSNFKAVHSGQYRVVITNPELLMKSSKFGFSTLFKDSAFVSSIIALVFDEAHCISDWGGFRAEFRVIGRLRHILRGVPYYFTSATLPDHILDDILRITHIPRNKLHVFHRSNDRPNVYIAVREMQHSLDSYKDLNFLVEEWAAGTALPRKFLVLFDSITECVDAGHHLRSLLPVNLRDMVKWHNSSMSREFREDEIDTFLKGGTIGFCATDTLGMGMDIPDFEIIVQYRAHKLSMCALLQRMGRGARNPKLEAVFILLVESKFFERNKKSDPSKTGKKRTSDTSDSQHTKRRRKADNNNKEPEPSFVYQDASPDTQSMSRENFLETRRVAYSSYNLSKRANSHKGGKEVEPKGPEDIDPALRDLINADHLGFDCYRIPITLSFKNDKLQTDDKDCRPGGCPSCSIQSYRCCCAIQNPSEVLRLCQGKPLPMPIQQTECVQTGEQQPATHTTPADPPPHPMGGGDAANAAESIISPPPLTRTTAMEDLPASTNASSADTGINQEQNSEAPRTTAKADSGRKKGKSKVAKYESGPLDLSLYTALDSWRLKRTITAYGEGALRDFGPSMILPNMMLDRIVDCAHWNKIKSVDDLRRETDWFHAGVYGPEVLDIIIRIRPAPVPSRSQGPNQGNNISVLGNNSSILNANPSFADPRSLPPSDVSIRSIHKAPAPKAKGTKSSSLKENFPQAGSSRKCGKCSMTGHNRRTCPLNENGKGLQMVQENPGGL